LEDDTLHILEPKVENSGIPHGVFLKRHKIQNPAEGRDYNWRDFSIGMELEVYGRRFKIVDCDDFTWKFFESEAIRQPEAEQYPDDPFVQTWWMVEMKQIPPDQAEFKEYNEVKLKGGRPNKGLQQYLDNDRKVLSFNILWNDATYHGGQKDYVLNFYLANN